MIMQVWFCLQNMMFIINRTYDRRMNTHFVFSALVQVILAQFTVLQQDAAMLFCSSW
jgi:hypothetical protein